MINADTSINSLASFKDMNGVQGAKIYDNFTSSFDDVLNNVQNSVSNTYKNDNIERNDIEREVNGNYGKKELDGKTALYEEKEKNFEDKLASVDDNSKGADKKPLDNSEDNIENKDRESVSIRDIDENANNKRRTKIKLKGYDNLDSPILHKNKNVNIKLLTNLKNGLKTENVSELSKNIENIKKYIESIDIKKIDKKDKKELESMLLALDIIRNMIEKISDRQKDNKLFASKNREDFSSTKLVLNDIDKIKESIKSFSKESNNSKNILKSVSEDSDEVLSQNVFKDIVKEEPEIKTKDKLKVNAESAVSKETPISSDKGAELTIVNMKDGADNIDFKGYNHYTNGALKSQNRTSSSDTIFKFQDMMGKLVEKAHIAVSNGKSEVIMSLTPEHFGKVRLKMNMDGDNLIGKIFVDNAEIKDIFTKNIDTVISSLNEVGINIEGFDVMLRQDMPGNGEGNDDENIFNRMGEDYTDVDINDSHLEKYSIPERRLNLLI